jgi:hypothetical protein
VDGDRDSNHNLHLYTYRNTVQHKYTDGDVDGFDHANAIQQSNRDPLSNATRVSDIYAIEYQHTYEYSHEDFNQHSYTD